jgi:hypothetical protein
MPWIVIPLVLQGCTTCQVSVPDGNAANEIHSQGIRYGNQECKAESNSPGLHDVVVKDNWFYDLIGVFTIGFAKPCEVSYQNVKPHVDTGGTPSAPKPATKDPHLAGTRFGNQYIMAEPDACQCSSSSTTSLASLPWASPSRVKFPIITSNPQNNQQAIYHAHISAISPFDDQPLSSRVVHDGRLCLPSSRGG